MEFHWLDLFMWLQYFKIYFENSSPSPECLQMLIEAQQNLINNNYNEYKNSILENFIQENKCCINN